MPNACIGWPLGDGRPELMRGGLPPDDDEGVIGKLSPLRIASAGSYGIRLLPPHSAPKQLRPPLLLLAGCLLASDIS